MPVASGARVVELEDKCDPSTFNVFVRPGTCVGDGNVTFQEFAAQLNPVDFGHDAWRMQFGRGHIDQGEALKATNEGGEFHTFTKVAQFGGGCIPELNGPLGLTPVAECAPTVPNTTPPLPVAFVMTGVNPGTTFDVPGAALQAGRVNHFQCLVHPWMRMDIEVRK
jgi:hypothetical protein